MNGKPTVISTFAGGGGSSLGYHWAGFNELLAIDFNKNACDTLKLNFPDLTIWERDIKQITANEILSECNIKVGDLDILDSSPPCQGFSTAGKRQVRDQRNQLFFDFVRLVNDLQPKVFVMENVSGIVKGKMKGAFIEIMQTLKELNYQVKCKLMNAKYYNVPQSRERLIFIGVRNDLNKQPSYPKPNKKLITVKEALKNCNIDKEIYWVANKFKDYTFKIKQGQNGSFVKTNYGFNLTRANNNKPSMTMCKSISPNSAFNGILHPIENRYLTISEAKRICSYSDNFKLKGNFQEQWAILGNSVMPKFMQAIAENIKENILN